MRLFAHFDRRANTVFRDFRKTLRLRYFGTSSKINNSSSNANLLNSNVGDDDGRGVQFNVLLTTDFFIMKDASHLRKIYWEYLIVDEAHR